MTKNFESAYLQTVYRFSYENKLYDLKIGLRNIEFELLCDKLNINSWAIITAYNPYSKKCSVEINNGNNQRLKNKLLKKRKVVVDAEGIPITNEWEIEKSFFVYNITLQEAKEFAIEFKQNAIVFGDKTISNQLVWTI